MVKRIKIIKVMFEINCIIQTVGHLTNTSITFCPIYFIVLKMIRNKENLDNVKEYCNFIDLNLFSKQSLIISHLFS